VFLIGCCLFGQKVNAEIYYVEAGSSQPNYYTNLEALRTGRITWADGDEIILHNDDSSLKGEFDFKGKRITISGDSVTISKDSGTNNVRFSYTSNDTLLTIDEDHSIVLKVVTTAAQFPMALAL
jgi:hypothetical protein